MAHVQSKRYSKSRATESCTRSVAPQATSGSSCRAGANMLYFSSPSVSLLRTGTAIEGTSFRWGSKDSFYCQALSDFSQETPGLCIFEGADLERHCQPCCFEVSEPRSRTWLKNKQMANVWPFGWNISLIACWPRSLLRLMNCWYQNDADRRIMSAARRL